MGSLAPLMILLRESLQSQQTFWLAKGRGLGVFQKCFDLRRGVAIPLADRLYRRHAAEIQNIGIEWRRWANRERMDVPIAPRPHIKLHLLGPQRKCRRGALAHGVDAVESVEVGQKILSHQNV